jgi:hypothetical protein
VGLAMFPVSGGRWALGLDEAAGTCKPARGQELICL